MMNGIYIVFIIFILFMLHNYFYVYEGADQEAMSYTSSIKDLLSGNKWVNPQTFDSDVTVNKKLCVGKTCIEEEEFKNMVDVISGKKSIYIYKLNKGHDYMKILPDVGEYLKVGDSDDSDDNKKQYGSWRISTKIPPKNDAEPKCYNLSTETKCL